LDIFGKKWNFIENCKFWVVPDFALSIDEFLLYKYIISTIEKSRQKATRNMFILLRFLYLKGRKAVPKC